MAPVFNDNERRRTSRHWAAVPVVMRHRGSRIDGISINLSDGGMYLFAAAHLTVGAEIELEFQPPDGDEMVCMKGTIRRRALYLYGIEYLPDQAGSTPSRTAIDNDDRIHAYEPESRCEF